MDIFKLNLLAALQYIQVTEWVKMRPLFIEIRMSQMMIQY